MHLLGVSGATFVSHCRTDLFEGDVWDIGWCRVIHFDLLCERLDVVRDLAQMGYQVIQVFQSMNPPFIGRVCAVDVRMVTEEKG